ncbi:DNA repair helicase [Gonapodya prolifera JEL478]|uniref:Regulator of telomere elongation helicase 1 homolog n=1 Tax=Gonapodya prolifera (strain JEL478) TaxID=1344416 RepID=A0A139AZM6_GONPJ|nr:DNA repair helicase [Gonapodya prolifera JEL478]|eukprot:KXS22013.1 DNA repair helicase [Gonapodya prolifera JEL478]
MGPQKQLDLRGVQTLFPYDPYGVQVDLMERVLLALQSKRHALIESPTGTGKTLCLLCAVLAWREHYAARNQLKASLGAAPISDGSISSDFNHEKARRILQELENAVGEGSEDDPPNPPAIYYASRTHSQLSNCVRELRNTGYRPRTAVLASREQLCLDDTVREARSNAARASMCRQKVAKKECRWHAGVESVAKRGWTEDRTSLSGTNSSEFATALQLLSGGPDGNEMSSSDAFQSNGVKHGGTPSPLMDIEDLVAFGRENSACPYFLSREMQPRADITFLPYQYLLDPNARKAQGVDLRGAIVIFDEAHNLESVCGDTTSFEFSTAELALCAEEARQCAEYSVKPGYNGEQTKEDFEILEALISKLISNLQSLPMNNSSGDLVRPGEYIFDLFASVKVTFDTWEVLGRVLEGGVQTLVQASSGSSNRRSLRANLSSLHNALKTCFQPSLRHLDRDQLSAALAAYRVHICPTATSRGSADGRTLSFWCFDSGVAMRDLAAAGVRNIILASGTLSPLEGVAMELGLSFDVRLENPHIISDNQTLVAVVTKGPTGASLNCSYQRRDDAAYRNDLGNAIVNFARTIPDGLLCFFPSYFLMLSCLESWKSSTPTSPRSILDRIQQHKHLVVEPQNKAEFARAIEHFYSMVDQCKGQSDNGPQAQSGVSQSGAIFFAVCRGKVSEGVDFSDAKARGVIVTGLPFPAAKDPKVSLKKQYLDDSHSRNRAVIDGATWYRQQATRAVNQAIGRAIRHKSDYGAIILLDDRFASRQSLDALPVWVRPRVIVHQSFATVQGALVKFFRGREDTVKTTGPSSSLESVSNERPSSAPTLVSRIAAVRQMTAVSWTSTELSSNFQIRPSNHTTTFERALRALGQADVPNEQPRPLLKNDVISPPEPSHEPAPEYRSNSSTSTLITNENNLSTVSKPSDARTYLDIVKATFSKTHYKQLQRHLKSFKSKEIDFWKLVKALEELLSSYNASDAFEIMDKFGDFVPKRFQTTFAERANQYKESRQPFLH